MGKTTLDIMALFEYTKSLIRLIMKINKTIIRKYLVEYINHTTQLIGIKDKLEATNKLIQDIRHNASAYRNFDNFKKRIYLALNITKEKTTVVSSRA